LERELSPKGKRKPLKKAFIFPGGGVGDLYQPPEKKYMIGKRILQTIYKYNFPVHILTKSTLVKRDTEIISAINKKSKAIVSSSFSSVDEDISKIFEPGVPSPAERLEMLQEFKQNGITTGMYLLPVIPFITDGYDFIDRTFRAAKEIDADFILYGGMTLKPGPQKNYFLNVIKRNYPSKSEYIQRAYGDNHSYGQARTAYYKKIDHSFAKAAKKYKIPTRIPLKFFREIVNINDLIVIIFEHIDHYRKLKGEKSRYGYAAYQISQIDVPLTERRIDPKSLNGLEPYHLNAIDEIIETGTCKIYEQLVPGGSDY
jgi:DNA repair photolyase